MNVSNKIVRISGGLIFVCMLLAASSCGSQKTLVSDEDKEIIREQSKKGNKNLYKEVNAWLGTPYKYGGNTRKGTDCSGFVVSVYQAVYGKKLYRSSYQIYDNNCKPIKKKNLEEGDLVFFSSKKGKRIDHVGIYLKNNKFAHATTRRGVIISDMDETYWYNTFVAAGRVDM